MILPHSIAVHRGDVIGLHYNSLTVNAPCVMSERGEDEQAEGEFVDTLRYSLVDEDLPIGKALQTTDAYDRRLRRFRLTALMDEPIIGNSLWSTILHMYNIYMSSYVQFPVCLGCH